MFTSVNNQAKYFITVKTNNQAARPIPYATRAQAVRFLEGMLVKFSEHAHPIKTDLDQLIGVSIPLSKSTYMIKKA